MNVSLRSVQLFRFDSEGRLKVDLLRHLHSVTSHYQVSHLAEGHKDETLIELVREKKLTNIEEAKHSLNLQPMIEQEGIRKYITENYPEANITYRNFTWVNHAGDWILRDTQVRRELRKWVEERVTLKTD